MDRPRSRYTDSSDLSGIFDPGWGWSGFAIRLVWLAGGMKTQSGKDAVLETEYPLRCSSRGRSLSSAALFGILFTSDGIRLVPNLHDPNDLTGYARVTRWLFPNHRMEEWF